VLNARPPPDSCVCDVTSHLALTALLTNEPGTRFRWRLYPESLDDHRARAPSVLAAIPWRTSGRNIATARYPWNIAVKLSVFKVLPKSLRD
jgi:hypothetical protein